MDGTLYDPERGAVPDSTLRALERLRRRGILRVICTGRHPGELTALPLARVEFDGYITLNGQLCQGPDGRALFGRPIAGAGKERLLRLFRDRTLPLLFMERERTYVNYINERVERIQQEFSAPVPVEGTYAGGELYQAVAFLTRQEEETLLGPLPGCKLERWSELAADIVSDQGGKAIGIARYLEEMGLNASQTMAFGDGENDVEMLRFVGTGVAMGNGHPAAMAAADYVTGDIRADGLAEALEHYHLL